MIRILLFMFSLNSFAYDFAPRNKPMKFTKTLTCVGIKWKNQKRHASAGQCKTMARKTASFYKRNSRGLANFITKAGVVRVPYNAAKKNVNKAENMARAKYKSDLYMIVNSVKSGSNAGGNTAHLKGTLIRTAQHEVGHLLNFGHAGRYERGRLDAYGDKLSVMGKYPSNSLTAPQMYDHGWYYEYEVAEYKEGDVYTVEKYNKLSGLGLKAVRVLPKHLQGSGSGVRPVFVSYPTGCKGGCLALHYQSGGGSQKIKTFGSDYHDVRYSGLKVKIIKKSALNVSFVIEAPKP